MRVFVALLLLFAATAWGAELKIPELTGPIVDNAQILGAQDAEVLGGMVRRLWETGKAQMTVLTVPDLQGYDIETFAVKTFEKWKLGNKGKDQGLLLVVSPNERKMRFEVGYGLEGDITDIFSKQVLSDRVAPYFRAQQYGEGLKAAVSAVAEKLGVDTSDLYRAERPQQVHRRGANHLQLFFLLLVFLLWIILSNLGGPRGFFWGGGGFGGGGFGGFGGGGGGWGGGGGDGGGWSGGGGGSGGGGASSDW